METREKKIKEKSIKAAENKNQKKNLSFFNKKLNFIIFIKRRNNFTQR